jgi:hypothetical protein
MGLSDTLRKFIDSSYEDFEALPDGITESADHWGTAFGVEFEKLLAPSSVAGLISAGTGVIVKTQLQTLLEAGDLLPAALDAAIAAAADDAVLKSNQAIPGTSAVAPLAPLDSENKIFKGLILSETEEKGTISKQIADLAEETLAQWVLGGTFVGLATSPTPIPNIPWGADGS